MDDQQQEQRDDDFETAFDEFSGEEAATSEPAGEAPADDGAAEAADGTEGETEGGEAQEPAEAEDPVAAARREAEEWKHRYNSDLGRQAALQRKIQEQEQLLRKLQGQQQKPKPAPQDAQPQQGDEAPDGSGMPDNEWKALQQDFPEFAKAIEFKLSRLEEQYGRKLSVLEQIEQIRQAQQQEEYVRSQYQALEAEHPDYREVARDPAFSEWLGRQPRKVQELSNSMASTDNAYLLRLYKQHVGAAQPQRSEDIQARRQRQLQQAQAVSGRAGRSGGNQPPANDYDAAFDFFASQG